jgi:hypothetical protein
MSADAAGTLDISITMLRQLELKGQLHPIFVGCGSRKVRLFLKEEVEQLAAARRVPSETAAWAMIPDPVSLFSSAALARAARKQQGRRA